jgi:hypothetical protein
MKSRAIHGREATAGAASVPLLWVVGAVVDIRKVSPAFGRDERSERYFVASVSADVRGQDR